MGPCGNKAWVTRIWCQRTVWLVPNLLTESIYKVGLAFGKSRQPCLGKYRSRACKISLISKRTMLWSNLKGQGSIKEDALYRLRNFLRLYLVC